MRRAMSVATFAGRCSIAGMEPIRVTHFSDVLCVWAYVSQIRLDELRRTFADSVELECRFLHVFGSAHEKLENQWRDRGGPKAYGEHVLEVGGQFGHVELHPEIWTRDAPRSSMPAHLFLCAVRLVESGEAASAARSGGLFDRAAWAVRCAFFAELADVSRRPVLLEIAERAELPVAEIERVLDGGAAHAALAGDLDLAREFTVRASPTLLLNEGRQQLTGNVGYRIIEANIRELLEAPSGQQSWC